MTARVKQELTRRPSTSTRARAALPVIAAFFRTGKVKVLAQRIEQGRSGCDVWFGLGAVDYEFD
jgi:hypothetical protein